jgi:glycosyltransferase involved in cell wall biosynthesis
MELNPRTGLIRRVAMIGNHTPRQCGIATFTADLAEAISTRFSPLDCFTVAMNDRSEGYDYPPQVRYTIQADQLASYRRAADFLNADGVDVVCLQHEYGIFGGRVGNHILTLLRDLRMPIVTTLHTILREPNADQCEVMAELTRLSDRLVVMSQRGAQFLREVHGVDEAKIDIIHHGIPNVPSVDPAHYKEQFNVGGKSVLLTFGLLSPDKGIENVIAAMPAILERFPDVVYIVLGATHPHILKHHGEAYRESLEGLAARLGVRDSVHFHNRFVPREELTQFLRAADIYITPYLKPEQITSGTLAYAVGSGKAVISTPYYYAEELLAEERGLLVPWRDPEAIAREVMELLSEPEKCAALQQRASEYGREMVWPAVAGRYMESFQEARSEKMRYSRLAVVANVPPALRADLPKVIAEEVPATSLDNQPVGRLDDLPTLNLSHLRMMTDDTGLLQHATNNVPNYDEGYCVDDNARALLLMTLLEKRDVEKNANLSLLATRYLAFVKYAFNPENGRFRNFLSYDRRWLEEQGSEDSHGRTLWALGTVSGRSSNPGRRSLADHLFRTALPVVAEFTSPRAWAYSLLGMEEALRGSSGSGEMVTMRDLLANRLFRQFQENSSHDWPWLEESITYANARLPQALLISGRRMKREDMFQAGLKSLAWLASIQRSEEGWFVPVGSNGFLQRGETPALFDQQPIEACGMVSACLEAFWVTGKIQWQREARRAFAWFLGQNQLQQSLYDPLTGGCCDGLHPDRLNENQGAESTLSFLQSLIELRLADRYRGTRIVPWSPQFADSGREPRFTSTRRKA